MGLRCLPKYRLVGIQNEKGLKYKMDFSILTLSICAHSICVSFWDQTVYKSCRQPVEG